MGYVTRHRVAMTVTATGGAAQAFYTSAVLSGEIQAIRYTRATSSGISTGAHFTITADQSGLTLLTATATGDVTWYPRAAAMDTSAAQLGMTSAATPPMVPVMIPLAAERAKINVTSGGTASNGGLSGTIDFYIDGV